MQNIKATYHQTLWTWMNCSSKITALRIKNLKRVVTITRSNTIIREELQTTTTIEGQYIKETATSSAHGPGLMHWKGPYYESKLK